MPVFRGDGFDPKLAFELRLGFDIGVLDNIVILDRL
jgi:hypothetical protein